ncbi:thiopurine S-methyltransferase [Zobellella maritima]|uniref:thiopurine S-methyltransferase n=1 Tax=Zobellella maritima TaxID=2059725 RepID=UPI000E305304|nr:thiopurine S-methyltransferase [Zobellella maritima]
MDSSFWHEKWQTGDIGFHQREANPLLVAHLGRLHLQQGSRVFLPLCGKSRDLAWLLKSGFRVVGAELSETAIIQLFAELGLSPQITKLGLLRHYSADNIDILVGDIFDVTEEYLSPVDAVYDRAALVALPAGMRRRYARHLMNITLAAPQLLITYEYVQSEFAGPPFSVDAEEVKAHYGTVYRVMPVARETVDGGLKGQVHAHQAGWLLITTGTAEVSPC